MGILDTLKWLWDPRTDRQKEYERWDNETPLQRRTQKLKVVTKDDFGKRTHGIEYSLEDWEAPGWVLSDGLVTNNHSSIFLTSGLLPEERAEFISIQFGIAPTRLSVSSLESRNWRR